MWSKYSLERVKADLFFLLLLLFIGGFFLRLSFICLVVCFFSPSFPETVSYDLVMLVS